MYIEFVGIRIIRGSEAVMDLYSVSYLMNKEEAIYKGYFSYQFNRIRRSFDVFIMLLQQKPLVYLCRYTTCCIYIISMKIKYSFYDK